MKYKYIPAIAFTTVLLLLAFFYFDAKKINEAPLLNPHIETPPTPKPTPQSTPSAILSSNTEIQTPTNTPSPTPTKEPTPKPTPTPTSAPSQTVNEYIERFGDQYSIDKNILRHVALCESGFRSNATNGPYIGLFQFDSTAWKSMRQEMGEDQDVNLRYSAEESVQTMAYALSKGYQKKWPNCIP